MNDALLAALLVLEPFFVLALAPLVTRRHVKKDAVALIEAELVPRVSASLKKLLEEFDAAAPTQVEMDASSGGRALVVAREEFQAQEEAVTLAVMERNPLAAVALDEFRKMSPRIYKTAVRLGPDAVLQAMDKLMKQRGAAQAPQVAYL